MFHITLIIQVLYRKLLKKLQTVEGGSTWCFNISNKKRRYRHYLHNCI